jgi:D-sedoheptulose 7-phosphate isomerase
VKHEQELDAAVQLVRRARAERQRILFIGNGGSAAIASHCAADWLVNGRIAAMCFNDGALLTCIGNDLGFGQVFSVPIEIHGRPDDLLVAVSSSGKSQDILAGVRAARAADMKVLTLSGFGEDNQLRAMGHVNIHVPCHDYGEVETTHLGILHEILSRAIA